MAYRRIGTKISYLNFGEFYFLMTFWLWLIYAFFTLISYLKFVKIRSYKKIPIASNYMKKKIKFLLSPVKSTFIDR